MTRGWVQNKIATNPAIIALVADRVKAAGSVGAKAENIDRPFIIIRAGAESPRIGRVTQQTFFIYAHVDPLSPVGADEILKAVNAAMNLPLPALSGSSVVMECRWNGDSDDLFDDAYGTATRFATHTLTVSQ